jgi:hypothetical protein
VSVLFLLVELGTDRYALDVRQVAVVLPLLDIERFGTGLAGE